MFDPISRRFSHCRAVLGCAAWKYLLALPTTALGGIAFWRDELLQQRQAEKLKLLQFLPHWPWYWWAIATLIILIILILEGSYRVGRKLQNELEGLKQGCAQLQLIFDIDDPQCVKTEYYWYEGRPPKSRFWSIGIRNSSLTKSADDVTLRAKDCWFTRCAIEDERRPAAERLIFAKIKTIEPGATEFVGMFGMDTKTSTMGDVFKQPHEFVIEARARDAATTSITLKYEPSEPATISVAHKGNSA